MPVEKIKEAYKWLDNPTKAKKIHGSLAIVWLAFSLPIMLLLSSSIPFVVFISVYAIVAAHWAGWDAAGGELQIEQMQEDISKILRLLDGSDTNKT